MSTAIQKETGNIWQFRVSGVLKKAELDAAQAEAREQIARTGKIKVLLLLEDFQGWEKGADWGDMTFTDTYGDQIERIAIVGDPKWETETLMFIGAGFRRTAVKFFAPGEATQARAWLKGGMGE
jgi:hypothetical protein